MRAFIIGTTLVLATSAALAQEIVPYNDSLASSRTRADVVSEAVSAQRAGGQTTQGEITQLPMAAASATAQRSDVQAQGRAAERSFAPDSVYGPHNWN